MALDTTQTSDVHARLAFAETERQQDKETHTEQLLRLKTSRKVLEETHTEQVLHLETSRKVLEDAHAEQLLHFETSRKSLETSMAAKQASVAALEESLGEHFCTAAHCNTLHHTMSQCSTVRHNATTLV